MSKLTHFIRLLFLWIAASTAFAGSATATLTVQTSVEASCATFNVTNLGFAPYTGAKIDATAVVNITCISGTSYNIAMGTGVGTGATVVSRFMTNQSLSDQLLEYKLYSDSGGTVPWGDGTSGTSKVTGTATGSAQSHTIYGTIPAGQVGRKTGTYSDTVTVTLEFN